MALRGNRALDTPGSGVSRGLPTLALQFLHWDPLQNKKKEVIHRILMLSFEYRFLDLIAEAEAHDEARCVILRGKRMLPLMLKTRSARKEDYFFQKKIHLGIFI